MSKGQIIAFIGGILVPSITLGFTDSVLTTVILTYAYGLYGHNKLAELAEKQ
jgi:hypothetical protein